MENEFQYDLAVAWTWKYDTEFIRLLESTARDFSLSVLPITPASVESATHRVKSRELSFRVFLDRASDEDEMFHPLARIVQKRFREKLELPITRPINPIDLGARASDKATMHLEFLSSGINVPYTIIISPYNHKKEVEFSISELSKLGRPFIIKPANTTGGGIGVVTGAESLKDVLEARQHHRNDKYLLQETIQPEIFGTRRAWFRVFFSIGQILPCWWDDQTHVYQKVEMSEENMYGFGELRTITERIAQVCRLDFFSTELVCTKDRRIVAVDYVNEMCDMRFQSSHQDGVPNEIVSGIVDSIVRFVKLAKEKPQD